MTETVSITLRCNRCGAEHTTREEFADPRDHSRSSSVIYDYPENWIAVTHYTPLQTAVVKHYCDKCAPEIYK